MVDLSLVLAVALFIVASVIAVIQLVQTRLQALGPWALLALGVGCLILAVG